MKRRSDSWIYYTDGTRIGYLQNGRLDGISLSTVHIPNTTTGTGFKLDECLGVIDLTAEKLATAFNHSPGWATGRDRDSVRKWRDFAAFKASSRFDSEYVRNGITQWMKKWKAQGWKTADRKPVKNQDLWMQLDEAASRHKVEWKWVKGHSGHPMNDRADALAVGGIPRK